MAKRKRLGPAGLLTSDPTVEAPPMTRPTPFGLTPARPPIAQVASDAAARAALEDLADEMRSARDEGRMVLALPLDAVDDSYLVRDRLVAKADELAVLTDSLRDRGQQSPIEVLDLGQGRYGLISGWRRLLALRRLQAAQGRGAGFDTVQALLRRPEAASDAYRAMVEENEIRVGLSFYERARIAARAAEEGVFADTSSAVAGLFAAAPKARRSKIGSFIRLYEALDDPLQFPSAISERLGLALVKAMDSQPGFAERLRERLRKTPPANAAAEVAALEKALRGKGKKPSLKMKIESVSGSGAGAGQGESPYRKTRIGDIEIEPHDDGLILTGPGLTQRFRRELEAWLSRLC